MRLARLYQKLHCEPLMLSEDAFAAFAHTLQTHMAAGPFAGPAVRPVDPAGTDATFQDSLDYYRRGRATMEQIRVEEVLRKYGPVAVVQIHGAIDRNLSRMEVECYGACDLQDINAALDELAADASVQTVILDFDTPGGNCVGHAETAARIVALRQTKNVIAWIGGQCHSLGVYLAVHCDYIIIGASAWMGSIGVRCSRLDMTKALAAQGISVTNFASSDEKTDFSPAKPLTPEEAARIQARVDTLYADFCARVRAGRPGMSEEFFKAQIFYGQEAIDAGLADEMADSLDEVASELLATAAVYASNAGSGQSVFALTAPRALGDAPFEARAGGSFEGSGDFDPSKHPRDAGGEFAEGGGAAGGTKTPAPATPSDKSKRAKAAHVYVGKEIQRYAEERNEPMFAKAIDGVHKPGNGPTDVEYTGADGKAHGIELKTVVKNTNQKLTMKASAQKLKRGWERKNKGTMHTVVIDDTNVYNAGGQDVHHDHKRVYYYRRGVGSFRLGNMHPVASADDVKKLIETPPNKLPPLAKKR